MPTGLTCLETELAQQGVATVSLLTDRAAGPVAFYRTSRYHQSERRANFAHGVTRLSS